MLHGTQAGGHLHRRQALEDLAPLAADLRRRSGDDAASGAGLEAPCTGASRSALSARPAAPCTAHLGDAGQEAVPRGGQALQLLVSQAQRVLQG